MIKTIPNKSRISRVKYLPRFSTFCSIGKAPFWGRILIVYSPGEALLEFESFEDWLHIFANRSLSIEEFCREIFDALQAALLPLDLTITVQAETTVHAPASATIMTGGNLQ